MIRTVILTLALASPVAAADFEFCWVGANDYTMTGRMTVPDDALGGIVTQDDVTAFAITGFHRSLPVGQWDLSDLTPTTTWHLRFDPVTMTFPTGGMHNSADGQAWNANGSVNDCGNPGFGFNSGTNAQDVCVNGRFITASSINRYTEFPVFPAGAAMQCGGAALLSRGDDETLLIPESAG
ncbi:hypothetical protein [Octadecabacter sp. R77987]|uniref:hypothetical protein n=1 Tax=Octadecabacter sp. R77987 TaxID=3093874 RepID=UPI0036707F02